MKQPDNSKPATPSSPRRRAASRANGALSRGPVTPEGKLHSSRNAVTHGLLASVVSLSKTEAATFNEIHGNYIERYHPRDQAEHDLIEEIVYAKYQMRQSWMMFARTLALQEMKDRDEIQDRWDPVSMLDRRTLAFAESLKGSQAIPLFQRYARSLSSQAERAMKTFRQLREERLPPPPEDPEDPYSTT